MIIMEVYQLIKNDICGLNRKNDIYGLDKNMFYISRNLIFLNLNKYGVEMDLG